MGVVWAIVCICAINILYIGYICILRQLNDHLYAHPESHTYIYIRMHKYIYTYTRISHSAGVSVRFLCLCINHLSGHQIKIKLKTFNELLFPSASAKVLHATYI